MPYRYRIDPSLGVAFFEGWGAFTAQDLFGSVRQLVADPDWKPGMVALCDVRRMDRFEADTGDVQRRTALDRSLRDRIQGSRCALVTASEEVYGMLRLYEGFSESWDEEPPPAEIGVFRDMAEARRWLGLPPDDAG